MIYLQIGISLLILSILYAIGIKCFYFRKYREKIESLEREIEDKKLEIDNLNKELKK
ncbi:hypothetical protein [Scatolibacter rhodanostii]|uniref:hypothetical protein n=1 Tax=Scatolibacter rhodanostii TaxID=2014781 RepID=UPI00135668B7|nr:hypothetical protein [Scatolibacter rhodanostii]